MEEEIEEREKKSSVIPKIIIALLFLIVMAGIVAIIWYRSNLKAVQTESEKVVVDIASGTGVVGISEILEQNNLIKNADAFKIYCKLNNATSMKAGKYELDKNMSVNEIIDKLQNGNIVDETVTITFLEGKNMRWIASQIADKTDNTEQDVYDLLKDKEYLESLIDKYWFIDKSIENSDIYYSLEGYLYPDTYTFADRKQDVKVIFGKMLDKMESVLEPLKSEIKKNDLSVHELLSLASIVELEAENDENRAEVAGVFYNRLRRNMALQSDVTTYYAFKIDMGDRDLSSNEIHQYNPYNTRSSEMAGKIPVGPICMMSESSIKAVVEPKATDALFFVADKNGNLYFSKTNEEHNQTIRRLRNEGLWYTYDE